MHETALCLPFNSYAQGVLVIRSRQQCGSFLKQSFAWMVIRVIVLDDYI